MSAGGASIHDLLVHGEFLRRLVRDLVADEAAQLDLTQQVWLQALRSPPRDARGLRGWLSTTARNLLANTRRSDARRGTREAAVASREHAPATDDILARESVRESVLRAVLALDDPFREAVLLRYYDGLAPRDIAARLGVPSATVRTRITRGLERLRARLDDAHGDRGAWALAALPLAHPHAHAAPFALAGGLAVKKLAVVLALLLLAFVAWRSIAPEDADPSTTPDEVALADPQVPSGTIAPVWLASAGGESERRAAATTTELAPRERRTFPAQRGVGAIHGLVVDAFDVPLAAVRVRAVPHLGGTPPGLALDDDRTRVLEVATDTSGRFRLADVDEGPVRVEARFPDESVAQRVIVLGVDEDAGPLHFAPEDARPAPRALEVLVVDTRGQPVEGAQVEAFGWSRDDRDPALVDAHANRPAARGTSSADGRAVLDGPALAGGVALARSSDGRAGWRGFLDHATQGSTHPLRIELAPTGSLAGVITGVSDESLRGARLSLHALSTLEPYHTAAGRRLDVAIDSTRFQASDLPAGTYAITLDAPAGARLVHPRMRWGQHELENSIAHITAVVEPGRAAHIELVAALGARLRGRVTAHGAPVANARVRAVLAPRTSNFPAGAVSHGTHLWRFDGPHEQAPGSPVSHRVVRTDADGRYDFTSLAPGAWRVEVAFDGLTLDRRMNVELEEGVAVELEHALVEAGVLQIGVLETSRLGVFPIGAEDPVMLAVVRDGCGTFAGLAPGRYRIASVHSDDSVPHVFLGEGTVEAGRTTWLDLRANAARVRVHGIVRIDGAPLAGATVGLHSTTTITDAGGRFEIHRLHAPRYGAGFGASIGVSHGGIDHVFVPSEDRARAELELDLTGSALEIEVLDANGLPIAARIEATWTPPTLAPTGPRESNARRGASDGRFTLAPLGPGKLAGRVVCADGWGARIECVLPRADPLRVVRPPTGTLTVRARRGGNAVAGLRVALEIAAGGETAGRWSRTVATDVDGSFVVEAPAGEVAALALGGFMSTGPSGSVRLEPGGAAEILLEMDE